MKSILRLFAVVALVLSGAQAQTLRDLTLAAQQASLRDAIKVSPLPWAMSGCQAAWDWRDVTLNGTRISQWTDKTGNGRHLTLATDSLRAIWSATNGAWLQGGVYEIAGGGFATTANSFTVVMISREWSAENPSLGTVTAAGTLITTGSSSPRVNFDTAYSNTMAGPVDFYGPAPLWSPNGNPSIFALASGVTGTTIYTNGVIVAKGAYGSVASTLTHVFGQSGGSAPMYRPVYAVLVYNRQLSIPELAQIAQFYGAPTQPAPYTVYCFGSSSIIANKATTYAQGCIQMFADSIGANRSFYATGGASWNGFPVAMSSAGRMNVHKGQRSVHVLMPQSNDLASHVAVATCEAAITESITRIKAADPFAWIILAPVTPRRASFTNGQTDADFDVDRIALNSFMDTTATATAGVVYADAMTVDELKDQADADNTTYFDADKIHMNTAGHLLYAQSLNRAFIAVSQGD